MQIKIKTPAKINLTLEILNKREDGFHNIQSIMQTINLYDYLAINVESSQKFEINLSGNSDKIPYNEKNIVYKAILAFVEKTNLTPHKFDIYIEKNIPIEAGLAGGSTNAAGTFYGLNKIFNEVLSKKELHELCAMLGSDLNVCLEGGCVLATGRGEKTEKLPFVELPICLIKPNRFGISAKEGYTKFAQLENKPNFDRTTEMIAALKSNNNIANLIHNDLELGVFEDYPEFKEIKSKNPTSIMSGSGSTYFLIGNKLNPIENCWIKEDLKTIPTGVRAFNSGINQTFE